MSNNNVNLFDEQEIKFLINSLVAEKERYRQEKLAQKIVSMKDERTAELVADLLYSEDGFIRNIAIELLVALDEKALAVLREKLADKDRNIRKFALDALKHIKGRDSCEIALAALDDEDENVVEAALEVIAQQQYKEAEDKLQEILKNANSVWIINALLRTFASLDAKHFLGDIEEKIFSLDVTAIEKNILVNSYVRALASIGSYRDIDAIIGKYAKDFVIDHSNLVSALSNLVLRTDISKLSEETTKELGRIFTEHWDYLDSNQILVSIAVFVKLQLDFFLDDIEEIFKLYKNEEFFTENLYELVQKLQDIPEDFVCRILGSKEPELVLMGIKLINAKHLQGYNDIVEKLCNSMDRDISMLAIRIIKEVEAYKNVSLLESLTEWNEEAGVAFVENINTAGIEAVECLLSKLEHHSQKVRKAAAQQLLSLFDDFDIELLEEKVRCNLGVEGIEALEVLFRMDASIGWKYITYRMDSMDESVRTGLVDIASWSEDDAFYEFMATMINDPSPMVRKKTIKVLNSRINEKSLCLLRKLYENEYDSVNRMEIISNLHRFSSYDVMNIVNNAACSSDTLTRIAAAHTLSFLNDNNAASVLQRMLEDQVEDVREAAKEAMGKKEVENDII